MKIYVGNYTQLGGPGLCVCELENDTLRFVTMADEPLIDPNYCILTRDRKTLLVVCGTESDGETGDSLATFDVTGDRPILTSIHSTGGGRSNCHVTLSPDERFAYVTCYATGTLVVYPFENGRVGRRVQLIQHEGHSVNPKRQEKAHTHFVVFNPEDGRLYCADLGLDAVMIYDQNPETGLLTQSEMVRVPEGMGPRHLVFNGNMMYVADELGGAVSVFRRTNSSLEHSWEHMQTISTLPEGAGKEGAVSAIRLDGERLFVSNRDNDSISVFEFMPGGTIRLERTFSTFGAYPRDFYVLPGRNILVANQNSGDIRLLGMEPVELPKEPENESGGLLGSLFNVSLTQQWLKPIIGEKPDTSMPGGVYQIGDELKIAGAVCVCPDLPDEG